MPARQCGHRTTAVFLAVGAVAASACLYFLSPERPGACPPCPFHYLTGLYCPGCGSLRAAARLLRGDVAGALGFNPLFVVLLPWILYECASEAGQALTGRGFPKLISGRGVWALLTVVIAYFVLRNVPAWPLTLLAP